MPDNGKGYKTIGLLKLLGINTKHEGQHVHTPKHTGKPAKADKPKRMPKDK